MRYQFAALRFTEDANLRDRVYWYLLPFAAGQGAEVLAPVGPNDRIQKARVERLLEADEAHAPYPLTLIKRVCAGYGERTAEAGIPLLEFGGVRYDDRHYTRFHALAYTDVTAERPSEPPYASMTVFEAPMSATYPLCSAILEGGALLVGGAGMGVFGVFFEFLRGKDVLSQLGLSREELAALRMRLG